MLDSARCGLMVVDVQGELASMVADSERVIGRIEKLVQCCNLLNVPVVWLEQYPAGLGVTVPSIAEHITTAPLEKVHFNAMQEPHIEKAVLASGCQQWLVVGIETHICVYQTVIGLLDAAMEVTVVTDCVSSRTPDNRSLAIAKIHSEGAKLTSFEMAVFELLKSSNNPMFKHVLKFIK